MATGSFPVKISFDEYLEQEAVAKVRNEYRSGEVFAMSGGTYVHGLLKHRASRLLENIFPGCGVIESDMKVFAPAVNEGVYPDVVVVCGDPQYYKASKTVVLNPMLIVEVLSPSTRNYDLGLKASFYRTIPSASTLIFIDSERQWIHQQARHNDEWLMKDFTHPGEVVVSASSTQLITVSNFYEGIELIH